MDHSSRDLLTVSLMNIGDKELNSVVCAAYKMGCDQTREVYQKRIEKLESALRDLSDGWECCPVSQAMRRVAREALKED